MLKKSISSLYLTAREEITREDAQIKTIQEKEFKTTRVFAPIATSAKS